ncbi:MAG TPA: metallophosphoesterase [Candidatus Polarisedimenticolaceae bacterium]|nr:metallophosphoesterase [Candidatus Polarisedimenticolaceae bacterium]
MTTGARDLVFIGDVHLERVDPSLADFLRLLDRLARTASRLVLMGDLFNVWIAGDGIEQPHQRAVAERLRGLRRAGLVVRYLEGNRDYRVGRHHSGDAFDDVSDVGLVERFGGRSIWAAHGDLVNLDDRPYRLWRRVSRSSAVWAVFGLLPRARRLRVAESIERRMRATNLSHKREFPERRVRRYAEQQARAGHDTVVLGHFHVEREIAIDRPPGPLRVWVLPEWRESRRHLVARADGRMAFVDS